MYPVQSHCIGDITKDTAWHILKRIIHVQNSLANRDLNFQCPFKFSNVMRMVYTHYKVQVTQLHCAWCSCVSTLYQCKPWFWVYKVLSPMMSRTLYHCLAALPWEYTRTVILILHYNYTDTLKDRPPSIWIKRNAHVCIWAHPCISLWLVVCIL